MSMREIRQRQGFYKVAEAARMLGTPYWDMRRSIDRGFIQAPTHMVKNYTKPHYTLNEIEEMRQVFSQEDSDE